MLILAFGLVLRIANTKGFNTLFDYDQYEDLFHTRKILLGDPPIIGRAVYGNPNLHHGVFYFYYNLIPYLLFKASPVAIIAWNNIFNICAGAIIFILAKLISKNNLSALISAFIVSVSYEYIQFSGWISSAAPGLFSVPLYFLGLWAYYRGKKWGLPATAFGLGMSIQLDLLFIYLVPIFVVFFLLFRPKLPSVKTLLVSGSILLAFASTFILTEIKLGFTGINTLTHFSQTFDDSKISYLDRIKMFVDKLEFAFANSLFPTYPKYSVVLSFVILFAAVFFLISSRVEKSEKKGLAFILLFLFSPAVMLIFGFHKQPWFLIGLPPAIALLFGFILSKIKYRLLVFLIIGAVSLSNINAIRKNYGQGPPLFKAETSSLLSSQLSVVDYTYQMSNGEPFSINSVTYPLYHNALWEYHYHWYGDSKFGYKPDWLGGEQLPMYRYLTRINKGKNLIYVIIDNTQRIPSGQKNKGKEWAVVQGDVVEEKQIGGFTVLKVEPYHTK